MKKDKTPKAANPADSKAAGTEAEEAKAPPPPSPPGLGLTERRRFIRPLPVPEVVESDADSTWGTFQALIADNPEA